MMTVAPTEGTVRIVEHRDVQYLSDSGFSLIGVVEGEVWPERREEHRNHYSGSVSSQVEAAQVGTLRRAMFIMTKTKNDALDKALKEKEQFREQYNTTFVKMRQLEEEAKKHDSKVKTLTDDWARQKAELEFGHAKLQKEKQSDLEVLTKAMSHLTDDERAALEAIARLGDPVQMLAWAKTLVEKRTAAGR